MQIAVHGKNEKKKRENSGWMVESETHLLYEMCRHELALIQSQD